MAKPVLSLKKKNPEIQTKPEIETKSQSQTEDIPINPIAAIEVAVWDYTPEEEFAPRQRKRRADKDVEQYRKEARWQ